MAENKNKLNSEENTPGLEIKPSEEYHERPMWHKIVAWVIIVLLVLATGACAFWPKL